MYKKYLLSVFVLFMAYAVVAPNTASAFWPFDYFKQDNIQKIENLTATVAKTSNEKGVTICQAIETLIAVGIIPSNQADNARKFELQAHWCSPSITVLSPNGGEMWKVGQTQKIKWKTENIPSDSTINLEIFKEGMEKGHNTVIYKDLSVATTSYNWSVSMPAGKYRIFANLVLANGANVATDISDAPFIITDSPISSSSSSSSLITLTDLSSSSALIDNGSQAPATSSVRFRFTMNNNSASNTYVSKTPSIFVATSTTSGATGKLIEINADSVTLSGDTSAYYIIPSGSSRKFILDGFYGKNSNLGVVVFEITKIYFGSATSSLQALNINSGLENLRSVTTF